jgi:DNA-binding NarL/FixJ family response regulator
MKRTVLVFGLLILAITLLFQLSKYAIISNNLHIEIVISIIAVVFFFVGIYIHKKSIQTPTLSSTAINHKKIDALEISKREYEVLQKIADGLSNKEIAEALFLSESTIKTHVSSLLVKLDAKRRTQAVQIAKSLQII